MKIAVIGGGSWGTALANTWATAGHDVVLLTRRCECANEINIKHSNTRYLPNVCLHERLCATIDKQEALADSEIVVLSVPTQYMTETILKIKDSIPNSSIVISTSKGIETDKKRLMSNIIDDELRYKDIKYAVLSGPSFAPDVAAGKPAAVVIAAKCINLSRKLRNILASDSFRIYSSTDVIGVECAGAIKTIMALAAGICDGLNYGESARAGLITRGLAEMTRFGVAMGGKFSTFIGLAGAGDLMVSCTAGMSRNRRVGIALAKGKTLEEALSSVDQVAEGFKTVEAVITLAKMKNIYMPIANTVFNIINTPTNAKYFAESLLKHELADEIVS